MYDATVHHLHLSNAAVIHLIFPPAILQPHTLRGGILFDLLAICPGTAFCFSSLDSCIGNSGGYFDNLSPNSTSGIFIAIHDGAY
jgi:hypothetical protein